MLGIPDQEVNFYFKEHNEYLTEMSLALFESSTWLWKGVVNNNPAANFYISGMTILVVNEENEKLLTLWNSDFGFAEKTNKKIVKDIVNDISKLRARQEKANLKINTEVKRLEHESESANEQIRLLNIQLSALQNKVDMLGKQINQLNEEPAIISAQIDSHAIKLCNSLEYKLDMMNASKQSA